MMGANNKNEVSVCANCGKGEEESDKLKACTACKMVKYCNRECQIAHRPQHKKDCKKKAKELHDEQLFKQPPPEEDCPICFQQLPSIENGYRYMVCCGKVICGGCIRAPLYDNHGNEVDNEKCAFCRILFPASDEELVERTMKRVESNDGQAVFNQGCWYSYGEHGFPQDYGKALELWHRAVKQGFTNAYNRIGDAYDEGRGVEKDLKKAKHYYELAAIGGDSYSRHNLGREEALAGNFDRALKHWMIALCSGSSKSLKDIQTMYSNGDATKDDYTKALQSYQAYLGEIKSDQRDKAAEAGERYRYY